MESKLTERLRDLDLLSVPGQLEKKRKKLRKGVLFYHLLDGEKKVPLDKHRLEWVETVLDAESLAVIDTHVAVLNIELIKPLWNQVRDRINKICIDIDRVSIYSLSDLSVVKKSVDDAWFEIDRYLRNRYPFETYGCDLDTMIFCMILVHNGVIGTGKGEHYYDVPKKDIIDYMVAIHKGSDTIYESIQRDVFQIPNNKLDLTIAVTVSDQQDFSGKVMALAIKVSNVVKYVKAAQNKNAGIEFDGKTYMFQAYYMRDDRFMKCVEGEHVPYATGLMRYVMKYYLDILKQRIHTICNMAIKNGSPTALEAGRHYCEQWTITGSVVRDLISNQESVGKELAEWTYHQLNLIAIEARININAKRVVEVKDFISLDEIPKLPEC